ncbi:hypothetical protein B0H10DRAFT_2348753 [Mycena sp. CBHHK59/15]|nr:hypothetical protein B0H10DRAFT_2180786 [Mycena sp. CBHHK59/15]KAJ6573371.1 hypothetical protein B0H10DRAFT_2348753 [Mycena sp. CBHHK59/15]
MTETFEVWVRSPLAIFEKQLANPDFKDEMDWAPKRIFKEGKRQFTDFFSGNWVWDRRYIDKIAANDPESHGAMFVVPGIFGSDKTTVSVGTGNTEFFHSTVSASRGPICHGFLSIPKLHGQHAGSKEFRKFRRQLLHSSCITRCADGHFRRAIYGLGPYIADYPEQVLLTCIVQGYCPRCLSPAHDLDRASARRCTEHTEALLEGSTLKELWDDFGIVGDIVPFTTDFPRADIHELISMDLLHKSSKEPSKITLSIGIAIMPPFPGLRQFLSGLMKVYLPAIAGHVPSQMVQAVRDLIEFCYLVRRSVIDEDTLVAIDALSLAFGAPNSLCSSITESKHIKAVKKPYRRSSRNKPSRLDKLAAARVDFTAQGMMDGALLPLPPERTPPPAGDPDNERIDQGEIDGPTCLGEVKLAKTYVRKVPRDLIRRFLFEQLNPKATHVSVQIPLAQCPEFSERVFMYNSARAVFYAPSDVSGIGGMHHERIRAVNSWYRGPPRYDCVFIEHDPNAPGFRGLHAARVRLLFRFKFRGVDYPCALVHWFSAVGKIHVLTQPGLAVVHIDCLLRGGHLIGVAGKTFEAFYVNKYADHHAHEIAF